MQKSNPECVENTLTPSSRVPLPNVTYIPPEGDWAKWCWLRQQESGFWRGFASRFELWKNGILSKVLNESIFKDRMTQGTNLFVSRVGVGLALCNLFFPFGKALLKASTTGIGVLERLRLAI
eukprot:TRINITY_DN14791_c0_g1_i1.p2 TRINITY_DN14791_c0_g1~~TRINITY_DN14791_c0_g1_i1.p2  ORF type:complete len:130 (-),score=18.92 TRINITY_DN14791_c0_g1_i1:182-547(-)